MTHDAGLIMTLAVAFAAAFVGGLIASRLRLPPLVGYLAAGVAVGPFTPGPVADARLAAELAEIGVILMMFGIGLHFSFRDLWAVRAIALPGAVAQIGIATALGVAVAWAWGWGLVSGLVFGLALSVASTVVLLRALEERRMVETPEGRIAVGWLIVEDLAMVLALVLLPALAHAAGSTAPEHPPGAHLPAATAGGLAATVGWTLAKVAAFAAAMMLVGTRLFPWLLALVARRGSRELFTVAVLATSVGVAYFAAGLFDISFALGAFFAGVVVGGSHLDRQVAEETIPLQDAFAVLFFVSVGMIVDPAVLWEAPGMVLATLGVILVGKTLAAFGLVWLLRYPLRTSLVVAASLAQIGEFSFILAETGVELGLLTPRAQDLILAGAIASIALNPLAFALAMRLSGWLAERPRYAARLERGGAPEVLAWRMDEAIARDHVVVVGHGCTGAWIVGALREGGVPVVVVERARAEAEVLHCYGLPVVFGDAARPAVLDLAGVANARMVVITAPDRQDVRAIVAHVRGANPDAPIVAAAHERDEAAALVRLGAAHVVVAEHAVARAMVQAILGADAPTAAGPSEGARG